MNNNDDNNGVSRRIEAPPPPFPPRLPCIVAIGIVSLIFMGAILTLFTVLGVVMLVGCLCWFGPNPLAGGEFEVEDIEDFDVEIGDGHAQNQNSLDDERVVEILEGFFRVVKGRGRGRGRRQRKKNESKKVLGSIECFGSEGITESGYSECSICLEDFQEGEKCLVFPVCGHVFHCNCIVCWLEKKLTCPVCRYSVVSKANWVRGSRSTSFLADLG